jgi:DNA-binding transcriptional MerR regulator
MLTVRDIAERIRRSDEEIDRVVDRLRNWTKEGLLRPQGEQNPGTGRARTYSEEAVTDALILTALTDWGIPAVRAAQYGSVEQTALTFGRMAVAEAQKKKSKTVRLVIARAVGKSRVNAQQVYVQLGDKPLQLAEGIESAIVINISSMIERIAPPKTYHLVVTKPFANYRKGERIEDPAEINRILGSVHQQHVVKVAT